MNMKTPPVHYDDDADLPEVNCCELCGGSRRVMRMNGLLPEAARCPGCDDSPAIAAEGSVPKE